MQWEILRSEHCFKGYFSINRHHIRYERFQTGHCEVSREIFERGHAVAVLPYDPVRDEIILIEQFRAGAMCADQYPWLMELIAGVIEEGEMPEDVARREALEESGCHLQQLIPMHQYLVSPGGTSETHTLYCAIISTAGKGGIYGLEAEGEDIKVHSIKREQALQMLEDGRANNAMTIIGLQWLALNHHRLRA